jgi:predicted DNA-binding transcriptional regulator YafY
MSSDKLTRCLKLIYLLQTHITRRVQDIASEVGVNKRTIYRYFRVLEDAGIPIRYDMAAGGHLIGSHFNLKAMRISDDELIALILTAQLSANLFDQEFGTDVNQAISKLITHLPNQIREELVNLLKACTADLPDILHLDKSQEVYSVIIKAIRKRQRVRITYIASEDSDLIQTSLAPYRLEASLDGWSVTGRSSLHRKILRFEFDQIHHAELTDDSFQLPCQFQRYRHQVRTASQKPQAANRDKQICTPKHLSAMEPPVVNHKLFSTVHI